MVCNGYLEGTIVFLRDIRRGGVLGEAGGGEGRRNIHGFLVFREIREGGGHEQRERKRAREQGVKKRTNGGRKGCKNEGKTNKKQTFLHGFGIPRRKGGKNEKCHQNCKTKEKHEFL